MTDNVVPFPKKQDVTIADVEQHRSRAWMSESVTLPREYWFAILDLVEAGLRAKGDKS